MRGNCHQLSRPTPYYGPKSDSQTDSSHVIRRYQLRVKMSNLFNASLVTFSAVHIAKSTVNGSIDVTTDKPVTFTGATRLTWPRERKLGAAQSVSLSWRKVIFQ